MGGQSYLNLCIKLISNQTGSWGETYKDDSDEGQVYIYIYPITIANVLLDGNQIQRPKPATSLYC